MSEKVEILSPAGSYETLKAAIASGCDAVYFGASSFNARRKAQNFTDEEIENVVCYCHARGVKAHLTINTLIFDSELKEALNLAKIAAKAGIDAIIIQDLGLASLIHGLSPKLNIHASTQLSCHNLDGVLELAKLGFSRVVLSRELSYKEIKHIVDNSPIETEVFVHGALCMSVSGQCYMSAFFGGCRSANRGLCAQPCRLPFKTVNHENVLSLKDLSLIDKIQELQKIGVTSLKIEGRMKRPEYVALTTRLCKKASLGQEILEEDKENLKNVFSRSGFTSGYYDEKKDSLMFGTRSKEEFSTFSKTLKKIHTYYENKEYQRIKVDFEFLMTKDKTTLICKDIDNNKVTVEGPVPKPVENHPLSKDMIVEKLSKTGSTPFYVEKSLITIDDSVTVSVSELNQMRRKALDLIYNERKILTPITFNNCSLANTYNGNNYKNNLNNIKKNPKITVSLHTIEQLRAILNKIDLQTNYNLSVYVPINLINSKEIEALLNLRVKLGIKLPRALFSGTEVIEQDLKKSKSMGINDVLCSNIGNIDVARRVGLSINGDFGLNVTNKKSLEVYKNLGIKSIILSFETPINLIRGISKNSPIEVGMIAYGKIPLMLVRNCPVKSFESCGRNCGIKDRMGNSFELICEKRNDSASEILNPVPIYLSDRKEEVENSGVDFVNFLFTTENQNETENIIHSWFNKEKYSKEFTRGLYFKKVD